MCNIDMCQKGECYRIDNIIPALYRNNACNPHLCQGVVEV